jgi:hypothetical protein
LGEARVIWGGVEAAGRRDDLTDMEHALEGFADILVVVMDAVGDDSGFQGGGTLLEGGEDLFALIREDHLGMFVCDDAGIFLFA